MDTIMNLLEQYWGYTLLGGMSVGMVITNIVTLVKTVTDNRKKNGVIDRIIADASNIAVDAAAKLNAAQVKLESSETRNDQLTKRLVLLEQVQAVMFKGISYLLIASKLPTEEKIAFQADVNGLKELVLSTVTDMEANKQAVGTVKDAAVQVVTERIETIVDTVSDAVEKSGSLLAKYTKEA